LNEDELRAVEDGVAGHEKLVAKLTSCPTPDPREYLRDADLWGLTKLKSSSSGLLLKKFKERLTLRSELQRLMGRKLYPQGEHRPLTRRSLLWGLRHHRPKPFLRVQSCT